MATSLSEVAVPAAAGRRAEEERRMVRFPPRRGLVKSKIYDVMVQALRSLVEEQPPEKLAASSPPPYHRPSSSSHRNSTQAGAPPAYNPK